MRLRGRVMVVVIIMLTMVMVQALQTAAQNVYAANPSGSEAQAFNRVSVQCASTRAPLNVTVLAADPTSLSNGDTWVVDNGTRHNLCFRKAGSTYCADFTLVP